MIIIVTGAVGIGKTTVCRKVVETLRGRGYACAGILTDKDAGEDLFVEDVQSGRKEILASASSVYDGPSTPKYSFNPEGISFGVEAIDRGTAAEVLIVDELGLLELEGEGFVKVIELVRSGSVANCILVIRRELLAAFLPRLDAEPFIFRATLDNRDRLPPEIETLMAEKLS